MLVQQVLHIHSYGWLEVYGCTHGLHGIRLWMHICSQAFVDQRYIGWLGRLPERHHEMFVAYLGLLGVVMDLRQRVFRNNFV